MLLTALVTSYLSTEMLCRGGCGSHSATQPLCVTRWPRGCPSHFRRVAEWLAAAILAEWLSGCPKLLWLSEWLSGCRGTQSASGCSSHSGQVVEWLSGCFDFSSRAAHRHKDTSMSASATPATQKWHQCQPVPPLPHKVSRRQARPSAPPDIAQGGMCHAYTCHAKWTSMSASHAKATSMSPSASPVTQKVRRCHQVPRFATQSERR